jgi:acyl carrier protein
VLVARPDLTGHGLTCGVGEARLKSRTAKNKRSGAITEPNQTIEKGSQNLSDIADRVRKIVVEHLNVDAEKVTDKASFIDDLGADSLDQVELVMAFEEEFSVEIPDDAAESIQTFGDAVSYLTKAVG